MNIKQSAAKALGWIGDFLDENCFWIVAAALIVVLPKSFQGNIDIFLFFLACVAYLIFGLISSSVGIWGLMETCKYGEKLKNWIDRNKGNG